MMKLETLPTLTERYFANAAGAVEYVPGAYVYLRWTGVPMSSTEVHALYVHAHNLLARHKLKRILADHRSMPPLAEADKEWLLTKWLPETVRQTGYSRCAVLKTMEPANQLHTDSVVKTLERFVSVKVFDDLPAAAEWLAGNDQ